MAECAFLATALYTLFLLRLITEPEGRMKRRNGRRDGQQTWSIIHSKSSFYLEMCLHNLVAVWGHMAPGLLVYSFPAQGIRHRVKFLRINIPGSFSGLGPWPDAKNELGFILDCFMVGEPLLLAPGPQLPLLQGPVSPTGQLWPGPGGLEVGRRSD